MSSSFEELQHFIRKKMRMSHIYQPVMLMSLLRNKGQANVTDIAKDFLAQDQSQVEYYEEIVKRWPTTTLKSHGLIERNKNQCRLLGFENLTEIRCELCGISAEQKALDIDHIVPRNKGGSDDISNLQALCYSCNRMKRDSDDTDFRAVRKSIDSRQSGCLFCEILEERVITENELAYAIRDGFPVTELHTLIIPKRHGGSVADVREFI